MVGQQGMSIEDAARSYGVSVSTFYRWRRLREMGGDEALAGRAVQSGLRRLTVEGRDALVELVRTDPSLGAKRLADRLGELGHEANVKIVYDELLRLDLNNESKRRLYLRRRGLSPQEADPGPDGTGGGRGLDQSLHGESQKTPGERTPQELPPDPEKVNHRN